MSPVDPTAGNPRPTPGDPTPGGPVPDNTPLEVDEDDDYELEAPDAQVEAMARQRAQEDMAAANEAIDVDAFYAEYNRGVEFGDTFKDFRFQVRHLMLLTAAVAVLLSLWKIANFAGALIMAVAGLSLAHWRLNAQEKQRQAEVLAKRNRLARAAQRRAASEAAGDSMYDEELEDDLEEGLIDEAPSAAAGGTLLADFKPRFSMKQVMIAITAGCIVLGLCTGLPAMGVASVELIAATLGLLAVLGVAAHIIGIDAPPVVALAWWVILVMYILLNVAQQIVGSGGA